jgi:phosphate transport system protein
VFIAGAPGAELVVLDGSRLVAEVEAEVLALLALQAPVARDLRVVLASRDIAQTAQLCLGLCRSLVTRGPRAAETLDSRLRSAIGQVGRDSADLLRLARAAWSGLDQSLARELSVRSEASRLLQEGVFTELLSISVAPVEVALDLGTAVRVYERLTDHALEIGARVLFAVTGLGGEGVSRSGR